MRLHVLSNNLGKNLFDAYVPFYEFLGLFTASDYINVMTHWFTGCGPVDGALTFIHFENFSYSIGKLTSRNHFYVITTTRGFAENFNLVLPSFLRDTEQIRVFNETVRDPFFLDSNLFNVSRLTMGYQFLGLPKSYGLAMDGRRDFTIPLEAFQSLFLLFPIDVIVVGNDVFLEIDPSYLRSTPTIVSRIEPRTWTNLMPVSPIPIATFNTFSDFYNSRW